MLPYSPLHHLLLADARRATLVMTSGNVSDEPIAYRDEDALERLRGIADLFLRPRPADRDAHRRLGRARGRRPAAARTFLRRSRGYVPGEPRRCPARHAAAAAGVRRRAEEHVLPREGRARVGQPPHRRPRELRDAALVHRGDRALRAAVRGRRREVVAHDLHPEYLSTKYALERDGVELVGVQHHHAHLAACLAEHGEPGPAVGAIFDGTGYGTDGTVWGGELLLGDLRGFRRVGVAAAGARCPAASARSASRGGWPARGSSAALEARAAAPGVARAAASTPRAWAQVRRLVGTGLGSPLTTSMGRLFDAVAALCGMRAEVNYEGQAAIELEAACDPDERGQLPDRRSRRSRRPARDRSARDDPRASPPTSAPARRRASIARRFHAALAARDRRGVRAAGRGARHRARGAVRRRVPEPAAARGGARA